MVLIFTAVVLVLLVETGATGFSFASFLASLAFCVSLISVLGILANADRKRLDDAHLELWRDEFRVALRKVRSEGVVAQEDAAVVLRGIIRAVPAVTESMVSAPTSGVLARTVRATIEDSIKVLNTTKCSAEFDAELLFSIEQCNALITKVGQPKIELIEIDQLAASSNEAP